eukprot:COSAG02_NODE_9216_length_2285_cov_3.247484_2_plen_380_part_00
MRTRCTQEYVYSQQFRMSLSKVWSVAGPSLGAAAGAALAMWAAKYMQSSALPPPKLVPPVPNGTCSHLIYMTFGHRSGPYSVNSSVWLMLKLSSIVAAGTPGAAPAMSLEGKVALVTGGGTGIGKEIARVLHAAGARVVITGRREEVLQKTVEQLGEGFGFVAGDVGEEADAERMVESCVAQFGSCDILINNAGIVSAYGKFSEVDVDAFDEVIKTNLRGTFLVSRAAIRQMVKQGRGGSIVNNSSCCGLAAWRHLGAYGASKGGINTMTQVMAVDHGADGIRVNGKCPAFEPLFVAVLRRFVSHRENDQPNSLVPVLLWRSNSCAQRLRLERSTRMMMRRLSRWLATLSRPYIPLGGLATSQTLAMLSSFCVQMKGLG